MKNRSFMKACFVLLLLLSLVSCKLNNVTTSLDDNSCNPPCWMRIEPGESTAEEALNILRSLDEVEQSSIERVLAQQFYPPDQIFFKFRGEGTGNLSVNNEIVSSIRLQKVVLSLKNAINKYGQPSQVMILPYWEWDKKWYVTLLYPEKGMILRYIKKETDSKMGVIAIDSNDIVSEIHFTFPDNMKSLIESMIFGSPEDKTFEYQGIVHEYKGYGDVKIIRP